MDWQQDLQDRSVQGFITSFETWSVNGPVVSKPACRRAETRRIQAGSRLKLNVRWIRLRGFLVAVYRFQPFLMFSRRPQIKRDVIYCTFISQWVVDPHQELGSTAVFAFLFAIKFAVFQRLVSVVKLLMSACFLYSAVVPLDRSKSNRKVIELWSSDTLPPELFPISSVKCSAYVSSLTTHFESLQTQWLCLFVT